MFTAVATGLWPILLGKVIFIGKRLTKPWLQQFLQKVAQRVTDFQRDSRA